MEQTKADYRAIIKAKLRYSKAHVAHANCQQRRELSGLRIHRVFLWKEYNMALNTVMASRFTYTSSLDHNTSSGEPVVSLSGVPHVIPAAHDRVALRTCTNVSDTGCLMTPQDSHRQTSPVNITASRPSLCYRSEISGLDPTAAVFEVLSQPNASLPVHHPSSRPAVRRLVDLSPSNQSRPKFGLRSS